MVVMLAVVSMNAQNKMYIAVGSSTSATKIPVYIYMTNEVEMAGMQASFELPGGLTKDKFKKTKGVYVTVNPELWPYDTENDDYAEGYYTFQKGEELFSASKPNDLLVSFTGGTTTHKIPTCKDALFGTFYFDGSTLADGTYTVKQYTATLFPNAETRYDLEDVTSSFTITGGVVSGINNITVVSKASGIYNIAGQQMKGLQKGINIVDGQKVYVK